jgi:hypothetical protein
MDAFQTGDNLFSIHAFYQTAYTLRVTVAATVKLHIVDFAVDDFKFDHLATSTFGIISVFHTIY